MSENLDQRLYETILEISFDFERLMNLSVKQLFYHFHCSTFKNNTVKPYAIIFIDSTETKHTLLFKDIHETLNFIPLYSLKKNITTEFAYLDKSNTIRYVNKSSSIYETLRSYFNTSRFYEIQHGSSLIPANVISSVTELLSECGLETEDEKEFVKITNTNFYISKLDSVLPTRENIIMPSKVTDYGNLMCIGSFFRYNNKDTSKRSDLNLAIVDTCTECNETNIVNYELGTTCWKCKHKIYY